MYRPSVRPGKEYMPDEFIVKVISLSNTNAFFPHHAFPSPVRAHT
jgi:hypothetical protein